MKSRVTNPLAFFGNQLKESVAGDVKAHRATYTGATLLTIIGIGARMADDTYISYIALALAAGMAVMGTRQYFFKPATVVVPVNQDKIEEFHPVEEPVEDDGLKFKAD